MITWFKLHHDLPDDIKIRRFTPQEKWAWVALLCLASKSNVRGVIDADDEDIAEYCEFNTTQDWLYFRDKLIAKGMLEINADGNLHLLHWEDRQYGKPSDHPTAVRDRVRRHRAKKKASTEKPQKKEAVTPGETPCNAIQTPVKRAGNATDIDIDPDLDLDPDKEELLDLDPLSDPDPESESVTAVVTATVTAREELTGSQLMEARFSGQLPKWRTGRGPNDWNEDAVKGIWDWLNEIRRSKGESPAKRSDAIAYIARREFPGSPDYPALVARIDEVLAATEKPAKSWRQRLREEKLAKASHET